jgi:RNase P/RNase MRP subunit p29
MTHHQEEFIGRELQVKQAKNKSLEGLKGMIINETKKTFTIRTNNSEEKQIPKKECKFMISGSEINGSDIDFRPEERIKNRR